MTFSENSPGNGYNIKVGTVLRLHVKDTTPPNLDKPKTNRMLSRNLICFRFGLSKLASKIYEAYYRKVMIFFNYFYL